MRTNDNGSSRLRSRSNRCAGGLVLASILFVLVAPAAMAQAEIDSAAYLKIAAQVSPRSLLRVECLQQKVELPGTAMTRQGFQAPHPWCVSTGDSTPADLIPWSRITRVEVRSDAALKGATLGALAFALFMTVDLLLYAEGSDQFVEVESDEGLVLLGASVFGGTIIGAFLHDWHTIYRVR